MRLMHTAEIEMGDEQPDRRKAMRSERFETGGLVNVTE